MSTNTDDLRIRNLSELDVPESLIAQLPAEVKLAEHVTASRLVIQAILEQADDRLVVVVGPCSIHDPEAALDYAGRLKTLADEIAEDIFVVMRVYFEKPRTTVGWKGLINDPHLDNSFDVNEGLRRARQLLLDINAMGLPTATEYLDLISPQYIADLISWGAIGARTTESQSHRELASGLSCPVGFKNGTGGNVQIAVDAIGAAQNSHHFLSVTKGGQSAIFETAGNPYCHLILRGGPQPNYDMFSVDDACAMLAKAKLAESVMIDASHANSRKQPARQVAVAEDIASQVERGDRRIVGLMLESFIEAGRQDVVDKDKLVYGQSITDPCMDWEQSIATLRTLAGAVQRRRHAA
ncbi:MAG: 3-deoxy-7-phosphoheptulonate synthase [Pseudomonadota bacterium]|nr:3-deoxy-7-phosphoheptulonate synthase [Pseudomonadota bacterium]